jgi:hypothetical protein
MPTSIDISIHANMWQLTISTTIYGEYPQSVLTSPPGMHVTAGTSFADLLIVLSNVRMRWTSAESQASWPMKATSD